MPFRYTWSFAIAAIACAAMPASAETPLTPVRLVSGVNRIPNIAGTGEPGTITLSWRENGNAWGYDIFSVSVHGSIVTIDGGDSVSDRPHVGEDMIRSVRFARGSFRGRSTIFALIADRDLPQTPYDPARTTIEQFALVRNDVGIGTPFEFVRVRRFVAAPLYCNADMALRSEIGLPLARSYSGKLSPTGC